MVTKPRPRLKSLEGSVIVLQQGEVIMDRIPGSLALTAHFGATALLLGGALILIPIAPSALAQTGAPAGSTINGTVPLSEGNTWGGLDHQPTPSEAGPAVSAQQQARISHKLNKLDEELLNDPLPQVPAGGPSVQGN
jgi:hypothetical protein